MLSKRLKLLALSSVLWTCYFWATTAQECPAYRNKPYSYDPMAPNGPENWHLNFTQCKGNHQTPINIVAEETINSGILQILKLNKYDYPVEKVKISNNGYRIMITPEDDIERSVTLDNIEYKLHGLHFHWGNQTNKGSEHAIDGQRFAMEAHFIHFDSNGNTLAVASLIKEDNKINSALDNILLERKRFQFENQEFEGEIGQDYRDPHRRGRIYLEDLIEDKCHYWRYSGSIGYPPCTEGVTWLICRRHKNVKKSQLDKLFSLYSVEKDSKDKDKCHLVNNYRPIQPLHDRKVYQ